MQVETKFLRLCQPAALGEQIDGWKVYWVGGWGRDRLFFYVMVARAEACSDSPTAKWRPAGSGRPFSALRPAARQRRGVWR